MRQSLLELRKTVSQYNTESNYVVLLTGLTSCSSHLTDKSNELLLIGSPCTIRQAKKMVCLLQ